MKANNNRKLKSNIKIKQLTS